MSVSGTPRLTTSLPSVVDGSTVAVIVTLAGDPMYAGIRPLEGQHRLADVAVGLPALSRAEKHAVGLFLVHPDGVTADDRKDPDAGPNNLQNFPVLMSAQAPTPPPTRCPYGMSG